MKADTVTPLAPQSLVPNVHAEASGAVLTSVYAIGQKSSGNAGNCGANLNAPTVVVIPVSQVVIGPCAATSVPAALTPNTNAQASLSPIATNASPVVASSVGVSAAL